MKLRNEQSPGLGLPLDLQLWCFLWEGYYPTGNGRIPKEQFSQ